MKLTEKLNQVLNEATVGGLVSEIGRRAFSNVPKNPTVESKQQKGYQVVFTANDSSLDHDAVKNKVSDFESDIISEFKKLRRAVASPTTVIEKDGKFFMIESVIKIVFTGRK